MLVGGSSRIPLVSEMLSAAFGRPLAIDNHPKHDVALGAAMRGTPAAQPPAAAPAKPAATAMGATAAAAAAPPETWQTTPVQAGASATAPAGVGADGEAPYSAAADVPTMAEFTPPVPSPDWRPPATVGPMSSPTGGAGHTSRLPAAVRGKRGRMLIGTGAVVVVALAAGVGILLGNRDVSQETSLTGVQSSIPPPLPAPPQLAPVPVVLPTLTPVTTTEAPPPTEAKAAPKRARTTSTTTRRPTRAVQKVPPPVNPPPKTETTTKTTTTTHETETTTTHETETHEPETHSG